MREPSSSIAGTRIRADTDTDGSCKGMQDYLHYLHLRLPSSSFTTDSKGAYGLRDSRRA
jgi:hypothetical protein